MPNIEHTCECCGDPIVGAPAVSAEGDDFCAPCTASLMGAEVKRLREALVWYAKWTGPLGDLAREALGIES
jgi:hypothetical protein